MPSTRNRSFSSSPPSDDYPQSTEPSTSATPSKKSRSDMNASEKREDTKLKNRLKQRAYRNRLADTISSLTEENKLLKAEASEAQSLAHFQTQRLDSLWKELDELEGKSETGASTVLVDNREIEQSFSLIPHPSFAIPLSSQASNISSAAFESGFPPNPSTGLLSHDSYEDDTRLNSHPDEAPSLFSVPSCPTSHFEHLVSSTLSSAYQANETLPFSSPSVSPYTDTYHTSHLRNAADSIMYQLEHKHPSFFQHQTASYAPGPSHPRRTASSQTAFSGDVGRNILGVRLGEGSAGSGYRVSLDHGEEREDEVVVAPDGLVFAALLPPCEPRTMQGFDL